MIYIKKYNEEQKNIWNEFINSSKNGIFMFNRDFMDYHSDRFIDNSLMFYDDNDNLIALLPANLKDNILYSHQGLTYGSFIVNKDMKQHKMLDCFECLKQYMQDNNIHKLIYKTIPHIYHLLPSEEDLYGLFRNSATLLKVEPSTTILLSNPCKMPKGRKAQISRAKREGVIIEESTDFINFIALENQILKKHHNTKAVHTGEELILLNSRFPENIKLYVAKYNNEIIAGAVLFIYENVVHTQYLAADEKAREIGALDLVINELVNYYKNSKKYFDFGISTEQNGEYLNEGLVSQKEGFGGRTTCNQVWELNVQNNQMDYQLSDVQSKNIGEGTNIWQYCVVLPNAKIGKNCNICSHCFIENDVVIGNNVTIKNGVYLYGGITIEDDVFVGPNATFCNDRYPKSKNKDFKLEPILIKKGASIGANAIILPGVTIGENSLIAAGAVVTKDVEKDSKFIKG